ncbi:MAG: type IV pilus assembly protein PilM [Candidatus Omnitrophota bacterium]
MSGSSNLSKNLFLGIDIGASSLKIVLLDKSKGDSLHLLDAVNEVYDAENPNVEAKQQFVHLAYYLKKFLRKNKNLINTKIGISIAGQSAFVRMLKIPITPIQKLKQIVLYETQQQVPFPIKEVVWDHQIYSRDKKQLTVLLAAVKKELVAQIIKCIEESGLVVDFIDVSNLALYNCLQNFYPDLEQTLVLDLGAKTTNIIVIDSGRIWTRSLPLGGEDITEAITKKLEINRNQAEQTKKEKAKVLMLYYGQKSQINELDQKIAEVVTSVLTDLTNEIVKTLNFYKTQYSLSINFQKVLITGGVSKIENIDKFFENSLAAPVEKVDFLNLLDIHHKLDLELNEFLGPAIGLALRGYGRSSLNINLLPVEYFKINLVREKIPYVLAAGVLLLLIFLSTTIFLTAKYSILKSYEGKLKQFVQAYNEADRNITQLNQAISKYQGDIKIMQSQLKNKHAGITLIDFLAASMPKTIWASSLELDLANNTVLLEANTEQDLNVIDDFYQSLKKHPLIKTIKVDKLSKISEKVIKFSFFLELEFSQVQLKH